MATITGQRVRSTLPPADTPRSKNGCAPYNLACPDASIPAQSARVAWSSYSGRAGRVRRTSVSVVMAAGRYPARHARPLPDEPPDLPSTIPVYNQASASGRMLALDLDPGRGDVDHQAAELGQLLEDLGGQVLADVSPSGGRHIFAVFAAALPWLELRDMARSIALRYSAVDPGPHASLSGQISPPGARAKRGGWRLLTTPIEAVRAAVEQPNGPEVWAGLLTEFAAELLSGGNGSRVNLFRQRAWQRWTTPAFYGFLVLAAGPGSGPTSRRSPGRAGGRAAATSAGARRAWPSSAPWWPAAGA